MALGKYEGAAATELSSVISNVSEKILTHIDLLRHGEPVGGKRYRGQVDDPLSERGWEQMHAATEGLAEWQIVVSSPLSRCAAFAETLAERLQIPVQLDARLKEIGFGIWEGRTAEDIKKSDPDVLRRFWRDPVNHRPAGAEFLISFRRRVLAAWNDILNEHHGKKVLVVAHAGIIRMIVCLVLGTPVEHMFRIQVANAGLTRIRIEGQGQQAWAQLIFHGGRP